MPEIRSIDLLRGGKEFAQCLNELLKRCRPQQVDGRAPRPRGCQSATAAAVYARLASPPQIAALFFFFATNNHLVQTPLLFHRQHG